jgi:hypothetical protein
MDIFQPIENFFVSSAEAVANFVTTAADDFFMKAQSIIVAGTYTLEMLVADIGVAVRTFPTATVTSGFIPLLIQMICRSNLKSLTKSCLSKI